jgi:hypothetical protein
MPVYLKMGLIPEVVSGIQNATEPVIDVGKSLISNNGEKSVDLNRKTETTKL